MSYSANAYGYNINEGVNVNADHGWGGYAWPNGVPGSLLGTAVYGPIRLTIRQELKELTALAFAIAKEKHGYTVWTVNPNGNGEVWGPWGYENRPIGGTSTASNHSKGKAMDWNAPNNGYANGFSNIDSDFPPAMVADLESIGWCWGGRYGDAMHWEYGYSPSDVAGHVAKAKSILVGAGVGGGIGSIGDVVKTPEQLEEEELMTAKEDILTAVGALADKVDALAGVVRAESASPAEVGGVVLALVRSPEFAKISKDADGAALAQWLRSQEFSNIVAKASGGKAPVVTPPVVTPPATYTVVSGDSFSAVAKKLGVTPDQLGAANPKVTNRDNINVGDVLTVPKA